MDVILAFPQIMLALVGIATVGARTGSSCWRWIDHGAARRARQRGAAQPIVERDFVAAAEALGAALEDTPGGRCCPTSSLR